jgi:hypothetical protein
MGDECGKAKAAKATIRWPAGGRGFDCVIGGRER